MKKHHSCFTILAVSVLVTGCASIKETAKVMWGSSTRALEEARADGISKTYHCQFDECFDAVLSLARTESAIYLTSGYEGEKIQPVSDEAKAAQQEQAQAETPVIDQESDLFEIFMSNRQKGYLVVMGIVGNVDTTEVGIFFSTYAPGVMKIEISSLSSKAKRKVAEDLFKQLDLKFQIAI